MAIEREGMDTVLPLFHPAGTVRTRHGVPALAAAVFTTEGVTDIGAAGVRKAGTAVPVTIDDLWHLGSATQAMTATLAATLVNQRRLSFAAEVLSFFPDLRDRTTAGSIRH